MNTLQPPRPARHHTSVPATDGGRFRESTSAATRRDDIVGEPRPIAPRSSALGRPVRPPQHRDATVFGVIIVIVLEAALVAVAAGPQHSRIVGVLAAAAIGALAVIAALWVAHRRTGVTSSGRLGRVRRGGRTRPPATVRHEQTNEWDESWFTGDLTGFPTDAVRPLLEQDAGQGSLYVAWVLAVHGHTTGWLDRHVDLPPGVADLLVTAARHHRP